MKITTALSISASLALLAAGAAGAATAGEIDLTSVVNANLNTYFAGGVYPPNGGPVTIGGIGFDLNSLPQGGTGVVQSAGAHPNSFVIPIGEFGVTTVYSIVNSAFGQFGEDVGSLTFTGSAGASFTYDFLEGVNVRDHATTGFNDIATGLFASQDYGSGDHLDVQKIVLSGDFATQTLTSVTFAYSGDTQGEPFLAALTTSNGAVPEPAAWALMIVGFGAAGSALRKRHPAPRTA